MSRLLGLGLLVLCACSGTGPDKPREICGNGKDDDNNGLTDCQDVDCAGQAGCPMMIVDGGNFGTCAKCGMTCSSQLQCLKTDIATDTPLPECVGSKCQQLNTNVQVHYELDTASYAAVAIKLRAINTRVISKIARDGTPVTCSTVEAVATGKTEADTEQIEKSGKFNIRGFDVCPLDAFGGGIVGQPFLNIGTGSGFLIWAELWAGPVSTSTKLPTGNRLGWGCIESGVEVAEVKVTDHCASGADAGACRTIRVKMPGPQ